DRKIEEDPDFEWLLGCRHDTSWKTLSYGITVERSGQEFSSDLDYLQWENEDPEIELFAEIKPFANTTMRLEVEDGLQAENRSKRLQYDGIRSDGILERSEKQVEQ